MTSISHISDTTQGVGNTILPPKRCRTWCFTINNHTEEIFISLSHLISEYKIKKIIFQEEVGKNDTPHLQGVIQFNNQFLFSKLKELYPTAHWEPCRSLKGSIKYCSKEETRAGKQFSYGVEKKELWKAKLTQEEIMEWLQEQHLKDCKENMDDKFVHKVMGNLL